MAKRDNTTKSNRAAQTALEAARNNPAISDFRKESHTFGLVAGGGFTLDSTEDLCAALLADFACGRIKAEEVSTYIEPITMALANQDRVLKVRELELKREILSKRGMGLPSKTASTVDGNGV